MKLMKWSLALGLVAVFGFAGSVQATFNGSPLVDALVKKGVLTSEEGEEVTFDLQKQYQSTPGGSLKWGSDSVKGVKIYGDVRLRYQWENRDTFSGTAGDRENGRFRYRLRAGADYNFTDNFKAGVRFSTAAAENSTNVTMESFFQGKAQDQIQADLYYLIYSADDLFNSGMLDSFEVGAGKFKNPFMIDSAFLDGDINPEGAYIQAGWEDFVVDGLDMTLSGGALILDGDFQVRNGTGVDDAHDFLFVAESKFDYSWAKSTGISVAPQVWIATPGESTNVGALTGNGLTTRVSGQNTFQNFGVFMLPVELKFNALGYPHAFKGTYGINFLDGNSSHGAGAFGNSPLGTNNQLFQVGYQLNSAKKKGTWQIGADYRYIEGSAWSSQLADSDFFAGDQTNVHGVVAGAKYAVTDFLVTGVTYFKTWDITNPNGAVDTVDLVQVDLAWKF